MPDRTGAADRSGGADIRGPDVDEADHLLDAEFECAGGSRARVIAKSIGVEVGEMPDERSGATVDREDRVVRVEIGAADLVALRAGTNTWIRLVGVAKDVAAACENRAGRGGGDGAGSDGGWTDTTSPDSRNDERSRE